MNVARSIIVEFVVDSFSFGLDLILVVFAPIKDSV